MGRGGENAACGAPAAQPDADAPSHHACCASHPARRRRGTSPPSAHPRLRPQPGGRLALSIFLYFNNSLIPDTTYLMILFLVKEAPRARGRTKGTHTLHRITTQHTATQRNRNATPRHTTHHKKHSHLTQHTNANRVPPKTQSTTRKQTITKTKNNKNKRNKKRKKQKTKKERSKGWRLSLCLCFAQCYRPKRNK